MKIGIMTAMDQEYEMVRKVLANNSKHQIVPVHCGWGKVNSAVNAYKLISGHHPDCIISTGCAGGGAVCGDCGEPEQGRGEEEWDECR